MWDFMKATLDQFTNTLNYRKHALNFPLITGDTCRRCGSSNERNQPTCYPCHISV